MAIIKPNWFYIRMAVAFNTIEATFRLYLQSKDQLKNQSKNEISKRMQTIVSSNPKEFKEQLISQIDHEYDVLYINTHSYSAIALAYSTVEYWLEKLTEEMQHIHNLPMNAKDFIGSAMKRISKFAKVAKLPPIAEECITRMGEIKALRDCIIHSNGCVYDSRDKKQLEQMADRETGLSIDEDGRLQFQIDYTMKLMNILSKDISDIFKSWNYGPSWIEEIS